MGVKMRQIVEKEIAYAVIDALLKAGYTIAVDNGEEETKHTTNKTTVRNAMFTTDEEYLYVREAASMKSAGWVRFIYGNDGWDVINDYTTNLEPYIGGTEVQKVIDKYAD